MIRHIVMCIHTHPEADFLWISGISRVYCYKYYI
uniref:Uncharacterized protein n=1 Tax=Rhizophora mucronata TaxID=61149 RepID=A0A2P2P4L0_RHIMU